jgi:hypothetical protein
LGFVNRDSFLGYRLEYVDMQLITDAKTLKLQKLMDFCFGSKLSFSKVHSTLKKR